MSKQIQISVPKPCHEDWGKMTPEQKGRFCGVCSKTVVDFTLMTDGQILDVIKNTKGKTCGHFSTDQLNRPLVKPLEPKWYMVGMWKYLISGFLIIKGGEAKAQLKDNIVVTHCTKKPSSDSIPRVKMGLIAYNPTVKANVYKGTVKDENGQLLSGVLVKVKGTLINVMTDEKGSFIINTKNDKVIAVVSYVGYETKEVVLSQKHNQIVLSQRDITIDGMMVVTMGKIAVYEEEEPIKNQNEEYVFTVKDEEGNALPSASIIVKQSGKETPYIADKKGAFKVKQIKDNDDIKVTISNSGFNKKEISLKGAELKKNRGGMDIVLEKEIIKEEEVVVIGYHTIRCPRYVTGTPQTVSVEQINTVDTAINVTTPETVIPVAMEADFTVYPNPAKSGNAIHINYNSLQKETIMFRLTNMEGKMLGQYKYTTVKGQNIFKIELPELVAGNIVIQLMNSKGKWIATKKLLVD